MKTLQEARLTGQTTPLYEAVVDAIWNEASKHKSYPDEFRQEFLQLVKDYGDKYPSTIKSERLPAIIERAHMHFGSTHSMTSSQFYYLRQACDTTQQIIDTLRQELTNGTPQEYMIAKTLDMRDDVAANITAKFMRHLDAMDPNTPISEAYPLALLNAVREFSEQHDAPNNKAMLCNGTSYVLAEVAKECERNLMEQGIDVQSTASAPESVAYVTVGLNMKDFMAGHNPTTQPGVEVAYYTSFSDVLQNASLTHDGHDSASCIMMVNTDALQSQLRPSNNPNILGYGTLRPQYVVDAMIQWRPSGEIHSTYISAEKCNWEMARGTVRFYQKEAFVKDGITWDIQKDGMTKFASSIRDKYIAEVMYTSDDKGRTLHNSTSDNIEMAMRRAFDETYHSTTGPEAHKIRVSIINAYEAALQEGAQMGERVSQFLQEYAAHPLAFMQAQTLVHKGEHELYFQMDANYHAAANFVALPDDMRKLASDAFNERMYELSARPDFKTNMEKYAAVTIAYAYEKILPTLAREYPECVEETKQAGIDALVHALKMGAHVRDAIVETDEPSTPGEGDISNDEDEVGVMD